MKTSPPRSLLSLIFVLGVGATVVLGAGCGGCPWASSSAVTVTPTTSCLALHIADTSGQPPSTGCVDPVLVGNNNCADTLTLPAAFATSGQDLAVAPSTPFAFEINLDKGSYSGNRHTFSVPADLGTTKLTISFYVQH